MRLFYRKKMLENRHFLIGIFQHFTTVADKQIPGLNIQVVSDMREHPENDLYEVSHDDTIIQHVTIENFGETKVDSTTGEMNSRWSKRKWKSLGEGTTAKDDKVDKLSQELVIRRDLFERRITSISKDLFQCVQRYVFYSFTRDKRTGVVEVNRLTFFGNQQFKIDSQIITDKNDVASEIGNVYQELLFSYGGNEKYAFSNLIGVIQKDEQLIIIHNTEQRTMPDGAWLQQQLQSCDPRRRINRLSLLKNLESQGALGQNAVIQKKVKEMMRLIEQIPKIDVTLGEVKQILKEAHIGWQGSNMRTINDNIASDNSLNVAFIPDIFLKSKEQYIQGVYGIGLINSPRRRDSVLYFVGLQQPMKKQLGKATRLKQLRLINISREDFIVNEFKDFERMLTVKFVKNGQYTVIPFPFKYLNEYSDLKKKMKKFHVHSHI